MRAVYQVARASGKTIVAEFVAEFVDEPRKPAKLQDIGFDYAPGWLS